VKFKVPFTKGKVIDFSVKSQSTFYPLNSTSINDFIGFDAFSSNNQSEQKLINTGYGENVTVYSIIKKIAQNGADIPKVLVDLNNPEEIIEDGEVFDMLQAPGEYQGATLNQFDYFENLITYILSSGNLYQRGMVASGFGDLWQRMEILPSGLVTPLVGASYLSPIQAYQFNDKQHQFNISVEEILHTKFVNPTTLGLNSLEGLSPLQAALYSLTGSTDIQKAISIMVKNQGARGVLSNKSERPMDGPEAKILADKANENIRGLKNFNKIHVVGTEMSYLQMGMSATDLKVIESGVLTDRQLCNAFSCPSVLFNDPANSSYNNYSTALKSLYTDAVIPVNNKILASANDGWLKGWSERDNKRYSWQMDTSGIEALQADQKEEADKDKSAMEGVSIIMLMPISDEGKKELLMTTYGYSEEKATIISRTNITTNE